VSVGAHGIRGDQDEGELRPPRAPHGGLWAFGGMAPRLSQLGSLVLNQRRFERIFFHFFLGRDVWFLGLGHLGLYEKNLNIKCS
jgi:hypothetical protein